MFVRTRFQYGSLRLRKRERSTDVWEFRYYETSPVGKRIRQSVILGDQALYRTEADARKATQALLMRLNDEAPRAEMEAPTFGALLDRYIEHERATLDSEVASLEHSETHQAALERSTDK
jgi:integrase